MKFRHSVLALLAVACIVSVAAAASLTVISQGPGGLVTVQATGAPVGSYVEAVATMSGYTVVMDTAPVDPATGMATVLFQPGAQQAQVVLHDPGGAVLAAPDGYIDILELD